MRIKLPYIFRALATKKKFRKFYIADEPVDLFAVGEFRTDRFPPSGPACWLDRSDAEDEVERRKQSGEITAEQAEICLEWTSNGYYIARGLIGDDEVATAWSAYERAIADGRIVLHPEPVSPDDPYPGRSLDPHLKVPELRALQHHPKILALTDLLLGRKTLPFQTIIGHKGSSQRPHSDSIHMTTYPLGYMVACWVALEDVHKNCGPLEFYPRSHRLAPRLYSRELSIHPREYKEKGGRVYNEKYEPVIERHIATEGLRPEYFLAKKGDVLFWHADLLHGGAQRKDVSLSRKALVCHYFTDGVVTYHDLSGNPTRLHRNGMYAPAAVDP